MDLRRGRAQNSKARDLGMHRNEATQRVVIQLRGENIVTSDDLALFQARTTYGFLPNPKTCSLIRTATVAVSPATMSLTDVTCRLHRSRCELNQLQSHSIDHCQGHEKSRTTSCTDQSSTPVGICSTKSRTELMPSFPNEPPVCDPTCTCKDACRVG